MKKDFTFQPSFKFSGLDVIPVAIWGATVFVTWLFMHAADHYLEMTPEALGRYFQLRWILIGHITAGGGALITGVLQFWNKLRTQSRRVHRLVGFVYLLAVLMSSFCALILASTTSYEVGWAYAFTLQIWAGVWITSTAIAYYSVIRKNFKMHEEWMIRSYIITVAFLVSGFALKIPSVERLGSLADVGPAFFWAGWAVPLFIFEIIRAAKRLRP